MNKVNDSMSKVIKSNLILKTIGWLQIIGGVSGLFLMSRILLRTETINGPLLLIIFIGFGLFLFSILTGKELLINRGKLGFFLTIINQLLQLLQWSFFGYGFSYSSGAKLSIGIKDLSLNFDVGLVFSSFNMYLDSNETAYFYINLVPVVVIILLLNNKKHVQVNLA